MNHIDQSQATYGAPPQLAQIALPSLKPPKGQRCRCSVLTTLAPLRAHLSSPRPVPSSTSSVSRICSLCRARSIKVRAYCWMGACTGEANHGGRLVHIQMAGSCSLTHKWAPSQQRALNAFNPVLEMMRPTCLATFSLARKLATWARSLGEKSTWWTVGGGGEGVEVGMRA